ncbi:steroid dehydrogenase [Plakobranchus ocellatus]|uniref:Steroid dehydrogenase n=1 Tax=Plakobranchus ocellatus TaxID=259542 RepID=A0AAV3Y1N0_9GAST|nr:steroid dehydrogenase [Plakobranchus ocellatus]
MAVHTVITVFLVTLLINYDDAILCHRCMSSMGGCGDHVVWRMYPWRDCGSSFCVKVIEKVPGEEPRYIRECEHNLLKSTRHRLRMPVLRRHGYCVPARKNDPFNPLDTTDSRFTYCFCNDWNGCNSAIAKKISLTFMGILTIVAVVFSSLLR